MDYDWYQVFNRTEFEALGLVSKDYELTLEGLGEKTITATKGNFVSLIYEGVILPIELNSKNPLLFDDHAVYVDTDQNVYLGILNAES